MVEVEIDSIRVSLMSQQRIVILKERNSERFLPIWIGPYDGGSSLVRGAAMETNRFFAGEWWRLLTALTAHSDPNHLAGNVVCLLLFGYAVCRTFGSGLSWMLILG